MCGWVTVCALVWDPGNPLSFRPGPRAEKQRDIVAVAPSSTALLHPETPCGEARLCTKTGGADSYVPFLSGMTGPLCRNAHQSGSRALFTFPGENRTREQHENDCL